MGDIPQWSFDVATGMYTDNTTGQAITPAQLRAAIEDVIEGAKSEARWYTNNLTTGSREDWDEWDTAMTALLLALHTIAMSAGTAGVPGLAASAEASLRATIAREKGYKARFLHDMRDTLATGGGAVLSLLSLSNNRTAWANRAASYMDAALITFEEARYRLMVFLGYTHGRRVEDLEAEHCTGCAQEAAKGYVPIADLKPLGLEECEQWCKCNLEYIKHYTDISTT